VNLSVIRRDDWTKQTAAKPYLGERPTRTPSTAHGLTRQASANWDLLAKTASGALFAASTRPTSATTRPMTCSPMARHGCKSVSSDDRPRHCGRNDALVERLAHWTIAVNGWSTVPAWILVDTRGRKTTSLVADLRGCHSTVVRRNRRRSRIHRS
jgi:hypothetical protein